VIWPPDYTAEFNKRRKLFKHLSANPKEWKKIKTFYSSGTEGCIAFINDFCVTVNPRNAPPKLKVMPFILFQRQEELVQCILECIEDGEGMLCEKSRDMGASWVCCAISVWQLLFMPDSSVGWGSRKEPLVDRIGDMDSLFEKMRTIINYLPRFVLPDGFDDKKHATFMRIISPENGASITGETGDNIGRGGRKTIYFKDEAQPLDEPVLTPKGWKKIGLLNVGDMVVGADGNNKEITNINDCGVAEIYKIILNDGAEIQASHNHLWKVVHNTTEKIMRTHELLDNFKYISPKGQVKFPIKITGKEWQESNRKLPLHPYVVGALLGDGSISTNGFGITSADEFIPNKIDKLLPIGSSLKYRREYWYQFLRDAGRGGKGVKSSIRIACEKSGIYGMKCKNKRVPVEYLHSGYEILLGLMDTDGSIYNGTNIFVNSSYGLCLDVQAIARFLGGKASIKKRNDGTHVVYLNTPLCPFSLPRKVERWKPKQTFNRAIKSVEYVGEKISRCITVQDCLYITGGYAVTHNSAHYERPEKIEAALGDNTDVQIDISSVNGTGNPFHRRRKAGIVWRPGLKIPSGFTRVFILDWRDHPEKDQAWYDKKRERAAREGLLVEFAQETDRDYSNSKDRVIIEQKWVKAAIDAHIKLKHLGDFSGTKCAAIDVADEGIDKNAIAIIDGVILTHSEDWAQGDTSETAARAVNMCSSRGVLDLAYDCIGVGAGIKGETNRLKRENKLPKGMNITPWNAAASGKSLVNPEKRLIPGDNDTPINKDYFASLSAQSYFLLAQRFYKTYKAITVGRAYNPEELISISSDIEQLDELVEELSQATQGETGTGKMQVNKKPAGTKSPNLADCVKMVYCPVMSGVNYKKLVTM